jgi:hypothetical protein
MAHSKVVMVMVMMGGRRWRHKHQARSEIKVIIIV